MYREYETSDDQTKDVAADIETCHRELSFWGAYPRLFNPSRWQGKETNKLEEANFFAFGAHPFACPARRRKMEGGKLLLPFGFGMLALLTGALIEETDGKWKVIGKLPGREEPLDTDRRAYEDLRLERVPLEEEEELAEDEQPVAALQYGAEECRIQNPTTVREQTVERAERVAYDGPAEGDGLVANEETVASERAVANEQAVANKEESLTNEEARADEQVEQSGQDESVDVAHRPKRGCCGIQ